MGAAYEHALQLYRTGDYAGAHLALTHDLAAEPNNARARALGALCNVAVRSFANAREWAELALDLDRNEPTANHAMALLLYRDEGCLSFTGLEHISANDLRKQRLDLAERFAREAVRLDGGSSDYLTLLASILYEEGDLTAAMDIASLSLALNARQCECHRVKARVFKDQGDTQSAIAATTEAIAHEPNNPACHIAHGWTLMYAGDYELATDHFFLARQLDPTSVAAKEGMLEGLRCAHAGYRLAVHAWGNKKALIAVVLLCSVSPIVITFIAALASTASMDDQVDLSLLIPVIGAAAVPIAWLIFRRPLYDWIIQFTDMGRECLSKSQRKMAWFTSVTLFLLCCLVAIGVCFRHSIRFEIISSAFAALGTGASGLTFHVFWHSDRRTRAMRRQPVSARSR